MGQFVSCLIIKDHAWQLPRRSQGGRKFVDQPQTSPTASFLSIPYALQESLCG
jgi:hypothetical protein